MRTTIRNPFEELMNPQEATNTHNNYGGGIMAIHNFANDNSGLMRLGKKYLREKSGMAYDQEKHGSKEKYVKKHLIPVLTDLQNKIENGEWDYVGNDASSREEREEQKKTVSEFLEQLKDNYRSSPNDAGVELY